MSLVRGKSVNVNQASEPLIDGGIMMNRRDLYSYFLLLWTFDEEIVNIGVVLDLLTMFMSKKTALNILKRLVKTGLVSRISNTEIIVNPPEKAFRKRLAQYFYNRLVKHIKCRGEDIRVELDNETIIYYGRVKDVVRMCPIFRVIEAPSKPD